MTNLFPISRFNLSRPLTGDIESLVDAFFNAPLRAATRNEDSFYSVPRANVTKDTAGFTIQLAAPGYSRDDFDISVENNILTISCSGESLEDDASVATFTSREYSYTTFNRTWSLPKNANSNGIVARYEAGILAVQVPTLESEAQTVTVNVE
jgi:HSP20 family protein